MIGNDVVDLATARIESNWERKGFLTKQFTTFEQELIEKANSKEEIVWVLWSLKESTYKAYQRIHYNRGFYPVKIEVQNLKRIGKHYHSKILLFGNQFYGKTSIENQVINTIVVHDLANFKRISTVKNSIISKDHNGLPYCVVSNKPVSISHHGNHKTIIQLNW